MANRTSNRAARWLFRGSAGISIRLSNRRVRYLMAYSWGDELETQYSVIEYKKPSRKQKRARRKAGELAE